MAERRAIAEPAQTVVKVGSDYYVLASSLASRRASEVLADGRSFAVFEIAGDIIDSPLEALGFFESDTRHLSRFEMLIAGAEPYFLNSYLSDDRAQFRDPEQRHPVTVEEAAVPFTAAGILIYSDAGAARGGMDHTRLDHTAELLVTLRRYTTAIAWLNPASRMRRHRRGIRPNCLDSK